MKRLGPQQAPTTDAILVGPQLLLFLLLFMTLTLGNTWVPQLRMGRVQMPI